MAEPQLSVRSARARDLAHRLARREQRPVADVVERALDAYDATPAGREPAAQFYARVSQSFGSDLDLDHMLREQRKPHAGIDL